MRMRRAVCLLSGGLDSATCLAMARRDGFTSYALSFDYGQRHIYELEAAARVCRLDGDGGITGWLGLICGCLAVRH